jgi:hypothetical protein
MSGFATLIDINWMMILMKFNDRNDVTEDPWFP